MARPLSLFLAIACACLLVGGCGESTTSPTTALRVAVSAIPDSAAFALGDVGTPPCELRKTASGKASLEALLAGEVDLATTTEAPILHALAAGAPLRVIATLSLNDEIVSIVADGDQQIADLPDLIGTRVAVTDGTNAPYALRTTLAFHDIDPGSVSEVPFDQAAAVEALAAGEIAAAVLWSPFREQAVQALGERAVTFSDGAAYVATWNLVTTRDAQVDPTALEILLRGLVTRSKLAADPSPETLRRIAEFCGLDPEDTVERLSHIEFGPRLDQSLLVLFEHQAMSTVPGLPMERILQALDPQPLTAIDPASCTVIR